MSLSVLTLPYISAIAALGLGCASLLRKRPRLPEWAFALGMLFLALDCALAGAVAGSGTVEALVRWQVLELIALSLVPGAWVLFSLSYARGNAGTFVRRWRSTTAAAFLLPPAIAIGFRTSLIESVTPGPTATEWTVRLSFAGVALETIVLLASILILMNLERTFRASVGTMRWRIKFMLLGIGLIFVVRGYCSSQALLFRNVDASIQYLNDWALLLSAVLIPRAFWRAGQFSLDVYPSHSLLQGSLTVLLAGLYLLIVGAFAKVVGYLGGDAAFSLKAFVVLVSLVGLATLLQSDRTRLQIRRFVSRNFQRPLYDYSAVWKKFTEGTASRVEQQDLCRALVRLVADMLNALSVSIWLADDRDGSLNVAASTFLSEAAGAQLKPGRGESAAILAALQRTGDAVDLETTTETWAKALKQMHPSEFPGKGGNRFCIRLIGRGEILGVIVVGDRVGGISFSLQDFEMLKCAADHASASILNSQLSRRLLQAKELEAFQTMAAFFVHDLKNAASTLNLMLQNLPNHFDDPEFREDALRGVGKSVSHINNLVSRLTMLRHELRIHPATGDLNELVGQVVAGFESDAGFGIRKSFSQIPRVRMDSEQITKVVTNLVLNAKEASGGRGQVEVATARASDWVVLSVADKGCGMDPEFMSRALFRPFQTTKKNGLGIGMFQSKMIVEAHGGRITASSEVGKGTTFQVFLPLEAASGAGVG